MNQDNVISALIQQLDCYQRLAKLGQVQREHVQQGDAESLLGVLQQRQEVLHELGLIHATLAPIRHDWPGFIAALPATRRPAVEKALREARTLLEEITRSDQDDVMLLQQRKLNLGRQINQASSSRQVNRAYATAAYGKRPANMDVSR